MQFTLATLTQAVKDEIEDTGKAFSAFIPTMIKGAEDACIADLDLEIFNATGTAVFSVGSSLVTIPENFLKVKSLYYVASSRVVHMEERTHEYCVDYWPNLGVNGSPLFWAPLNTTQIFISPPSSVAITANARGPVRPASLVTTTTGTWLSLNCGDLLFKRSLMEAEKFNKADERIEMWKGDYIDELARKSNELHHLKNKDYELGTIQPAG